MRILLTTILMLVCIVAYSATPSYSNFSSNQFAPSGTYTVTVKAKAELTNTVFRGVGTPAAELHGGWLSTNDTTGSITVMSNASTVWSNGATAGSVAITNAGGVMNLEGGPFGANNQFRFNTSGSPCIIISNGGFGVGKAPDVGGGYMVDVVGRIKSTLNVQASYFAGSFAGGELWLNGAGPIILGVGGFGDTTNAPALSMFSVKTNLIEVSDGAGTISGASGAGFSFANMYFDPTPYESATNTLVYSRSNALYVSDPTAAPGSIIRQNASAFMTPATITNLLNVTAGQTNGIFVNTNGPLVYIWSDGWNIYSKTIAP